MYLFMMTDTGTAYQADILGNTFLYQGIGHVRILEPEYHICNPYQKKVGYHIWDKVLGIHSFRQTPDSFRS